MTPRVAILRGEWLNPFELQSFQPLLGSYDLVGIATRRGLYDLRSLPVPVVRLREIGSGRIGRRLFGDRGTRLRGLDAILSSCAIVHAAETFLPITEQAVELRDRRSFKLVATCWENIPFLYEDDPRVSARKDIVRAAVDLFLAVTEEARQALLSENVESDLVVLQPVGVDRRVFRPARRDEALLRAWRVPEGWQTVLYCGRLIREKGVLDLVRALVFLPRTILIVVGEGPERSRLQSAARALGVENRLRFVGASDYADMPRVYATGDAFCLPSVSTPYWQEQFGMVLVEAMACGTPIVTTATGSIPEVVGDAALVVPPYAPEKLGEALTLLQRESGLRAALIESGLQRVNDRFDAAKVSASIGDLYRQVLSS